MRGKEEESTMNEYTELLGKQIDELEAENKRLREAFERMQSIIPHQHCRTCNLLATHIERALSDFAEKDKVSTTKCKGE